ncbi:hypothetical protein VP01_942g2 [Puccinia sorghi]|uniref:HMG box domain-containing protein n=1 Tax=Puccinia sorghi TaxID=27349 RepID=A0A0L6U750_9BASI|nr:hypothetical protein VP01_942g2 [Puccinia sorghi]
MQSHPRLTLKSLPRTPSNLLAILGQPRLSSSKPAGLASSHDASAKHPDAPKSSPKLSNPVKTKTLPLAPTFPLLFFFLHILEVRPAKLVPPKRAMNIMQLVTQDVMSVTTRLTLHWVTINQELKQKTGKLSQEDAKQSFRLAAEKYRSLSDEDKKNYYAELDRRREIYEIEMREFLDSLTPNDYINQAEYVRRRKAQGRSIRRQGIPRFDPNAPKRPLNGFMIFCGELRSNPSKFPELAELIRSAEKDNSSVVEGSKLLANYWRSMPDDLKQPYVLEAQKRSDLYKQEKAEYDAQVKSAAP